MSISRIFKSDLEKLSREDLIFRLGMAVGVIDRFEHALDAYADHDNWSHIDGWQNAFDGEGLNGWQGAEQALKIREELKKFFPNNA